MTLLDKVVSIDRGHAKKKNAKNTYIHNYPLDEQQKNSVLADQNVVIISFPQARPCTTRGLSTILMYGYIVWVIDRY